ncbi:hypothetical protein FNV43_RR18004 [Rhamnella rubrinervis]|uniref:Uncharacterized protein n=1 Tax=Rhamnella rubrinervis TaxID=2594499 RepID=A0A8K0E3Q7_9ROSA|nr:hypothetical protein FNV43_RR18004 [Rhamnella rubrinervis]
MSVLDSPLEPLTFNFLSFGFFTFVHNLWTWLALITAAVSVWKIRASGSGSSICLDSDSGSSPPCNHETSNGSPPVTEVESSPTTSSSIIAAASAPSLVAPEDDDGVGTKGTKFRVYYESDDGEGDDGELTAAEESGAGEEVEVAEEGGDWWESWERMLKMRSGEMSWYRYQDMRDINGNVVRLWDGFTARQSYTSSTYKQYCVLW